MSSLVVKDSVQVISVEYAGLGSKPYFIILIDGEYKFVPIELGSNTLTDAVEKALS